MPKLIAMFIPGAGFISAIISIYDTVMVFVEKIKDHSGRHRLHRFNCGDRRRQYRRRREEGRKHPGWSAVAGDQLPRRLPGLWARSPSKIKEVVNKVRDIVDKALDTAINFIIGKAKALFASLFGKDKDKKDDAGDVKTKVKNELASRLKGEVDPEGAPAIIMDVRAKYLKEGLKSLKAIETKAGDFDLDAVASPGASVGHFTVRDFEKASAYGLTCNHRWEVLGSLAE